ncbi:hypothetical protein ASPFODRAFT_608823 [Aspergillus luchuensis CBS 106.47]|uniref:Uncharacterized protein n=1 Tax=Aspergillus luchuensis (strain CBS 106.47) TaxID=1137211 RepID=A0A1M3TIU0_ASPLC|nr:hypothetical protein ASPFODRAFT_608823 [Aspergillus luchuensis CBS 106.47]
MGKSGFPLFSFSFSFFCFYFPQSSSWWRRRWWDVSFLFIYLFIFFFGSCPDPVKPVVDQTNRHTQKCTSLGIHWIIANY